MIELKHYRDINKGCITASFSIYIKEWGLTIHNILLMEKDGKHWFAYPTNSYTTPTGEKKNFPYIFWDEPVKKQIEKTMKEALDTRPTLMKMPAQDGKEWAKEKTFVCADDELPF